MSRAEGTQQGVVYIGIVKTRRNWAFVFLSFLSWIYSLRCQRTREGRDEGLSCRCREQCAWGSSGRHHGEGCMAPSACVRSAETHEAGQDHVLFDTEFQAEQSTLSLYF